MLERFRRGLGALGDAGAADDEHLAALELLLAVVLADRLVSIAELEDVEREVEGGGWETATFSYQGRFGPAMAAVRAVLPADRAAFVADRAARITSPELRRAVRAASHEVAQADGAEDPGEHELLAVIDRHLS